MQKPELLYHGSQRGSINELEPRVSKAKGAEKLGPLVYATQDKTIASCFMIKNCAWGMGIFWNIPYVYIICPREKFLQNDHGGYIYVLPSQTFSFNITGGLGEYEWASKERVKPTKKLEYQSVLDTLVESGVQVYFIDQKTHEAIKQSRDHGLSIFVGLESENQKRGINIRPLDQKPSDY